MVLRLVCQSLQGFSYLLTYKKALKNKDNITCQSLQGFSYLLTNIKIIIKEENIMVSIPSRVLISSNWMDMMDGKIFG